jgi:hypothetical protein
MHRTYFCLAAFISLMTTSVAALAEPAAPPLTAGTQRPNWATTANAGGFYIDLPAVTPDQLIERIRACRTSLTHREEEIAQYLDEHRLNAKDTLITVIIPGGLIYAAIRTGDLEQAKAELAEVNDDMDALARDLLAMQAIAGDLTVARLQQ